MDFSHINDPAFVSRLLGGDGVAFDSLVEEMAGVLKAIALKRGVPRADAEDLVQNLFIAAHESIQQHKFYRTSTAKLTTYVVGILFKLIAEDRRKKLQANEEARQGIMRHAALGDPATMSYFGEPPESLARLFVGDDAAGGKAEAPPQQVGGHKFYSLSKLDRDILTWRYFRWSYKEIAAALAPQMALTENALRQRYYRAAEQIGMNNANES